MGKRSPEIFSKHTGKVHNHKREERAPLDRQF